MIKEAEGNFQKNIYNVQREACTVNPFSKIIQKSENMISKLNEITIQTKSDFSLLRGKMSPMWKKYEIWKSWVKDVRADFLIVGLCKVVELLIGVHICWNTDSPQAPAQLWRTSQGQGVQITIMSRLLHFPLMLWKRNEKGLGTLPQKLDPQLVCE